MKHIYVALCLLASIQLAAQNYELSPTFGKRGAELVDTWSGSEIANTHAMQQDGQLLVAGTGYWNAPNSYHVIMARMDTTCGALDTSFGDNGTVNVVFEQRTVCNSVALQSNGKIVGCGLTALSNSLSQHKPSVYRLNTDGSVDTSFNGNGYNKSSFDGTSSGTFWDALVLPDGRITCAGGSIGNINGGIQGIGAQRFLADGTLDPSFGSNGIARIPLTGSAYSVNWDHGAGILQPDGKVISITMLNNVDVYYVGMARFNEDGSPDMTFGAQGLVVSTVEMSASSSNGDQNLDAELLPNGNILVSGPAPTEGFIMARFMADGSLDGSYGSGGTNVIVPGASSIGRGMSILSDGSSLQFGTNHWANGPLAVVKRLEDGTVDMAFGVNGIVTQHVPVDPFNEQFHDGFMLPSGRIIGYGTWNSGSHMLTARFTTDAASEKFVDLGPDTSFCANGTLPIDAGIGQAWMWSNGDSMQVAQITSGGTYDVCVTNAIGCRDWDDIVITTITAPSTPNINAAGAQLSTSANGTLQWYFNGTLIPDADQPIHIADQNGDYTVSVTNGNGCSATSDPFTMTTVGVSELNGGRSIAIFPNPAHDVVQITINGQVPLKTVELTDALGRRSSLQHAADGTLNVSEIPPGQYWLAVSTYDGEQFGGRLIVQ